MEEADYQIQYLWWIYFIYKRKSRHGDAQHAGWIDNGCYNISQQNDACGKAEFDAHLIQMNIANRCQIQPCDQVGVQPFWGREGIFENPVGMWRESYVLIEKRLCFKSTFGSKKKQTFNQLQKRHSSWESLAEWPIGSSHVGREAVLRGSSALRPWLKMLPRERERAEERVIAG